MGGLVMIPVLAIALALVVAGGILMVRSRLGVSSFPSCGRCRYDVTGSIGMAERCPECGAAFAEVGIRPPRRSRGSLMAAGVGMVACSFVMMVSLVIAAGLATRAQAARAEAMAARAQAVQALQAALQAEQAAAAAAAAKEEAREDER
ncbi:MAG: hypothetical protein ACYTF9_11590 [Planctomycetota bacterium]|jgi:hypothetical protein